MKRALLASLCLHALAVILPWHKTGQLSGGIRFGCLTAEICYAKSNEAILPADAPVYKTGGYDGQFYYYAAYRIAGADVVLDSDSFRMARIGFPLLLSPFTHLGPIAVTLAMCLIPFLVHCCALVMLSRGRMLFALNPFSVLSASLFLADGLAFSFAAIAFALQFQRDSDSQARRLAVLLFTAAACLCKETALALPLASLLLYAQQRRPVLLYCALGSAPLLLWWFFAGFSPLGAAVRGTHENGLLLYLAAPDSVFSGRGLLILYAGALLAALLLGLIQNGATGFTWLAGLSIAGAAAASPEYWNNFANVARLFFPSVLGLLFLKAQRGWAWFYFVFSALYLYKEARAEYLL